MNAQLQLETSRPGSASQRPSSGAAGREELHPEGTGEIISHVCAPPSTGRTPAVPGEPLTFPADRETTDLWAENFRRRGVECEVVPNGRRWEVRG